MLTAEMLDQTIRDAVSALHYACSDEVERGRVIHTPAVCISGLWFGEYIICHPDDLDELRQKLTSRRLIPLRGET